MGIGILGHPSGSRRIRATARGAWKISYTAVLLAVVVGIVHAGLAPVIEIAGVRPNLVLVAVVLVTSLLGLFPGIVWAFVAGLTANLLVQDPLGSVPMSLLLVSAAVAGGDRILGRLTWLFPILAAFAGSILADLVSLGLFRLVGEPLRISDPLSLILPAAVLNAAIVGVLLYPARVATGRLGPEERTAW
ncbi:MAG TPA: rod shape-determining protein MreD [Candidatus Dormibacteraeota bacterium]|nr:rod shape-determining protein MreD [Candidatus Dormibacteraeota bacterium]